MMRRWHNAYKKEKRSSKIYIDKCLKNSDNTQTIALISGALAPEPAGCSSATPGHRRHPCRVNDDLS